MSEFIGPPTADQFWSAFRVRWLASMDQMRAEFKYDIAGVDPGGDPNFGYGPDLDQCFDELIDDGPDVLLGVGFDYERALHVARWYAEGYWSHMFRRR